MITSRKPLLVGAALVGAASLAALAAQGGIAQDDHATVVYRADLMPLNNSGAHGMATLRLSADHKTLTVMIKATGLEAGNGHSAHIHGLSSGGAPVDSTCPTSAQDTDGDGFVELVEGQAAYGPILIDFMNIDPNNDGTVNFTKTITLNGGEGALPLTDRHIVVHGLTVGAVGAGTTGEVDGTAGFKTVLPVLCGEIEKVGGISPHVVNAPGR